MYAGDCGKSLEKLKRGWVLEVQGKILRFSSPNSCIFHLRNVYNDIKDVSRKNFLLRERFVHLVPVSCN